MKFTDLTKEEQKHFKGVVDYYGEDFPEDATHVDLDGDPDVDFLLMKMSDKVYFWHFIGNQWFYEPHPTINYYPIPEKPWYDPEDVDREGVWVEITNPSDIKKYPVGTKMRINGVENELIGHYGDVDNGFDMEDPVNGAVVYETFAHDDWGYCTVEVFVKQPNETTLKAMEESLEDCETLESDVVKRPNHYQLLPEYEVKDVMKALLDRIEESDFRMTHYEAGWFQQSMQYFLRFYAKNGLEDLEKGIQTMQFVVDNMKERGGVD